MKRNLPTFRKLVIQYRYYKRKLDRLTTKDHRSRQKISWIKKRIVRLRSKIDTYIERGKMAKKVAMVAAGVAIAPLVTTAQTEYTLRGDHPFAHIAGPQDQSSPVFVDFDEDGDRDLFLFIEADSKSGAREEAIRYYENTDNGFVRGSVSQFPEDIGYPILLDSATFINMAGSFADFDEDGDLDLFLGADYGDLRYLTNNDGVFEAVIGEGDPFDGFTFAADVVPAMGDVDGDGDVDAFIGHGDTLHLYINDGGVMSEVPFAVQDDADDAAPSLIDIDNDGDLDLVVGIGNKYGELLFFENVDGNYDQKEHPLTDVSVLPDPRPAFADVDGDGDLDLITGNDEGSLMLYNLNESAYEEKAFNSLNLLAEDNGLAPEFFDYDDDGDVDLFMGTADGNLLYYENTDGALALKTNNDLPEIADTSSSSVPIFTDIDSDGDADLVVGHYSGILLYENTASGRDAAPYVLADSLDNPFHGLSTMNNLVPTLADFDADGDLDLLVGNKYGTLEYFVNNDGTYEAVADSPFAEFDVGGYSAPSLDDIDADGDLDLTIANSVGRVNIWENDEGDFKRLLEDENPFHDFNFHDDVILSRGDLDGDGDLDVIVGNDIHMIFYLENTTSSVSTDDRQDVSQETNVFPNPVTHTVQIEAAWNEREALIEVFDFQGRLLREQKFFGTTERLDLSTLPSGTYQMRISNRERKAVKGIFKK
ncbi:MAG: T9SS type A sorting domain-containing protein [Saprospiraceae bacterium]|nr:T9SS type A sorting domain-containing protein [Saprospiraceae bacterium]